jgi:hypothetical protein
VAIEKMNADSETVAQSLRRKIYHFWGTITAPFMVELISDPHLNGQFLREPHLRLRKKSIAAHHFL